LGERLNGIQEVSGSIPLISTITKTVAFIGGCFFPPTADLLNFMIKMPAFPPDRSALRSRLSPPSIEELELTARSHQENGPLHLGIN